MRYHGLDAFPEAIRRAIEGDPYDRGDCDISVTQLIDAPQIKALQEQGEGLSTDARRAIAPLIGQSVHAYLERFAPDGQRSEQRLFAVQGTTRISGQMDLQEEVGGGVLISDYKVISARSLRYDKPGYVRQLNSYAWLCRANGKRVLALQVIAILKDWSEREARKDASYPQSPVVVIPIELWSPKKVSAYIRRRVALHDATPVPECLPEERWTGRNGPVRCLDNWCGCATICPQFQKERAKSDDSSQFSSLPAKAGAIF